MSEAEVEEGCDDEEEIDDEVEVVVSDEEESELSVIVVVIATVIGVPIDVKTESAEALEEQSGSLSLHSSSDKSSEGIGSCDFVIVGSAVEVLAFVFVLEVGSSLLLPSEGEDVGSPTGSSVAVGSFTGASVESP